MAKVYDWEIKENTVNEETEEEMEVTHAVRLRYSALTGKAVITIDGSEFTLKRVRGTDQAFRLGDMAAILHCPKWGEPDVVIDGVGVRTGKTY